MFSDLLPSRNSVLRARRLFFPLFAGASILLTGLACQLNVGGRDAPGPPVPVSEDSAELLKHDWGQALLDAATTGDIVFAINEAQLTSLIVQRLSEQEDPIFTDPNVYLRDGVIQLFGETQQSFLRATVFVEIAPVVDADGNLSLEVTSAQVGPIPAPEPIRRSASSLMTEAFTGSVGPFATGFRIDSVSVADGLMIILAEVR